MNSQYHGYRSDHLREDAYYAQTDQVLLANLREALELHQEAERCAAGGRSASTTDVNFDQRQVISIASTVACEF